MIVYAESSAVLAWLLGETSGVQVRRILSQAERVVSSSLTATECARAIARGRHERRLSDQERLAALRLLDMAERSWDVHACSDRVLTRARGPFPIEPIRTLDAIHLATAVAFQEALGPLAMLSYDGRILSNAEALGFDRVN
jgi:predicted nucleic acid-binding protein